MARGLWCDSATAFRIVCRCHSNLSTSKYGYNPKKSESSLQNQVRLVRIRNLAARFGKAGQCRKNSQPIRQPKCFRGHFEGRPHNGLTAAGSVGPFAIIDLTFGEFLLKLQELSPIAPWR